MEGRSVETSGSRRSVTRLARRQATALALAASVLLVVTAGALAVTGDLTQPAGPAGCISETGAGNCADGHALNGANGVAVSGDGKNVYATSYVGNAVARLNRNTDHRGAQPASRERRLRQPNGGGTLRRRPRARQSVRRGGLPRRKERLCRLIRE